MAKRRKQEFEFCAPDAKEVFLVGNFNWWDPNANPMRKGRNGVWKAALSLAAGIYEYRFLADGSWVNDPGCACCVDNGFGSRNCVKVVE